MRLWHQALIPRLPRQQLLGQHRECCALRGLGWGRKHATVNYVFDHPYGWLVAYHLAVIEEMKRRGYHADCLWCEPAYRGQNCMMLGNKEADAADNWVEWFYEDKEPIYPEHNDAYLQKCLANLADKGIYIDMEETK